MHPFCDQHEFVAQFYNQIYKHEPSLFLLIPTKMHNYLALYCACVHVYICLCAHIYTMHPGCLQVVHPYSPLYCMTFSNAAFAGKSITVHKSCAFTSFCWPSMVTFIPRQYYNVCIHIRSLYLYKCTILFNFFEGFKDWLHK